MVRLNDPDAMAAKVTELGGTVCIEPTDIPNTGRFAVIEDPQGAFLSIIRMKQVDPIESLK